MSHPSTGLIAMGDSLSFATGGYVYKAFDVPLGWMSGDDERAMNRFLKVTSDGIQIVGCSVAKPGTSLYEGADSVYNRLTSHVVPLIRKNSKAGRRKYILTILSGTNPDTDDPAIHVAHYLECAALAKSFGIDEVLIGTIPSRTDGVMANFDTSYQQIIKSTLDDPQWIITNPNVSAIIPFASNPNIGAVGAADNTTYFVDKVHPTDLGYTEMAATYWTAIEASALRLAG